ncbi:MAG: hypothetical protein HZB79_05600 [Deltaproteobacteria bacterium]|nr:hypothetical protein [Deltaproteobacteria bacterium]
MPMKVNFYVVKGGRQHSATVNILEGIRGYLLRHGIKDIKDLIGSLKN